MTEKNDWADWIELSQNGFNLVDVLDQYPEYMHKAVVLALSVAKWHPDNPDCGYGYCAACAYQSNILELDCEGCLAGCICDGANSLYKDFCYSKDEDKVIKITNKIYKILREKYDKELAKVEKRGKTNGR